MDATIEKLILKRRKKTMRFLLAFVAISGFLLLISPLLSLFVSLLLAGTAAYGMSPSKNLYRGFTSSAALSGIAKETAKEIHKVETEEISQWKSRISDLVVIIFLFMSVFIISLVLLYIGWAGIISYLS